MEIFRVFQIEAAHYLPNVPEGHKCRRLHGHSFRIEVRVEGQLPRVVGERTRLNQVFQNLIGNAIEYMDKPKGQIRIAAAEAGKSLDEMDGLGLFELV